MINNQEKYFLELVKAGLWNGQRPVSSSKFQVSGNVDWGAVCRLAEEQSVVGMVAAGIEALNVELPLNLKLQFVGATLQTEQRNREMNTFLADLVEKMRKSGIYALVLKGQCVAQCYERPLWRSCGDIDFFLSDDNYQKAKNYLLPLASSSEHESQNTMHLGMTIDGFVVELHGSLRSGFSSRADKVMDEIQKETFNWRNVHSFMVSGSNSQNLGVVKQSGTQVFSLSVENHILFVFTHFLKHFYKEGLGLRQVCDWVRMLWTYHEQLDSNVLEKRLRQMGLMSEWRAFYTLATKYFGMPEEVSIFKFQDLSDAKCERKADRIIEFILNVGNMGHNRDMSHFQKYPYLIRKYISAKRRIGDALNHARIFPLDSLLFSFTIMRNGMKSAMRGEG